MSLMGKLARMDSALQRTLDNTFALVFGGRLVPAEIEELLKQEAEDGLKTIERGKIQAPNYYRVGVSLKDFDSLSEEFPDLPHSFTDRMTRFIRNNGWSTDGSVVVTIEGLEYLHTGQLHSASYVNSDPKTESVYKKHEKQHKVVGSKKSASSSGKNSASGKKSSSPSVKSKNKARGSTSPVPGGTKDSLPGRNPVPIPGSVPHKPQQNQKRSKKNPRSKKVSPAFHNSRSNDRRDPRMNAKDNGLGSDWYSQPNPEGVAARYGQNDQTGYDNQSSSQEPTVTLTLQDGSSCVYSLRTGSNTIGRGADVDVRLADTGVSRQHAEIVWDGHDAVLVDLHSTNGTVVNGTPIENWLLAEGDVISIGHTSMSVHFSAQT